MSEPSHTVDLPGKYVRVTAVKYTSPPRGTIVKSKEDALYDLKERIGLVVEITNDYHSNILVTFGEMRHKFSIDELEVLGGLT